MSRMSRPTLAELMRVARRITPVDVRTALVTVALAPLVEIGLRTVGVQRTARRLGVDLRLDGAPEGAEAGDRVVPLDRAERRQLRVAWRLLALGPFDGTCLRRSLIGARLLRRRSHAVRIGVRKVGGELTAHAWLEIDGVSLDPAAPAEFASTWQPVAALP